MLADPTLLVVDDEEAICQGCRRIFARQGFQVDVSSRAPEGLSLASQRDYAAILLDINMPLMDGIAFLEELRRTKPDVPVIFITGYPSLPYATSAVRLGASDFITKPFTPETIVEAVQRSVERRKQSGSPEHQLGTTRPGLSRWIPANEDLRFVRESWARNGRDGTVRVGALLARPERDATATIRLPQVGEMVYQGLPWASVNVEGEEARPLTAPVSGVVVEVNPRLRDGLAVLWDEPFGDGWIARVEPTRLETERERAKVREVILATTDTQADSTHAQVLAKLGCRVRVVNGWEQTSAAVAELREGLMILDAAAYGELGPSVVKCVNTAAPDMKVVVVATPDCHWEREYRQNKIFYYAVQPVAEQELVQILDGAFRPPRRATSGGVLAGRAADSIASLWITNRQGTRIRLLAGEGMLWKDRGLGKHLRAKLLEQLFPLETTLGAGVVAQYTIMDAARNCDHVMLLIARDMGRPAGSLVCETKDEVLNDVGPGGARKLTTLLIQPDSAKGGVGEGDPELTEALADHVVHLMSTC